jgi:hypothetical protein
MSIKLDKRITLTVYTLEQLLDILKINYTDENLKKNIRKKRVCLSHLTQEERTIYNREWNRLATRKQWLRNLDENGVNQKKKAYYKETKDLSLMKASYLYHLERGRVEDFIKKRPENYETLLDISFANL